MDDRVDGENGLTTFSTMTPMPVTGSTSSTFHAEAKASDVSRRTLRICHVSMTLLTGGLERLLVDFGRFHDQQRFRLRFLALDRLGPPADDLRSLGHSVDSLQLSTEGKWSGIRKLARRLRDEQIDLVHTHNTYAHFYGTMAAKMAGVKAVVNSQHGRGCGDTWKHHWQFRLANRWTDRIVGVSEDAARLCREQDRRSAHKIVRIWNGIDVDRFAYHGPSTSPVAISVARLSKEKDFPTLLQAVAIALPQIPDFRLRIVGDGAERPRLENLTRELGLTGVVEFLGERHDVPELLTQAGFFVSSSRTEGVSLTLLEAMAVGLPVLTTRVGGNPEVVEDGVTGRLVEPQDPAAFAAGLVEMCRRCEDWPALGQCGRLRVEQNFEIRGMVQAYERLYDDLLHTPTGCHAQTNRMGVPINP